MIDDRIKAKMKQLKLASGETTTTDSTTAATTVTSNDAATAVTTGNSVIQQSPAKALSLGLKGGKGTMTYNMLSSSGMQSRLMQPTAVSVSSISGVTVGANGRLTSSAAKDINEVNLPRHI
jgi:hypothetical protein